MALERRFSAALVGIAIAEIIIAARKFFVLVREGSGFINITNEETGSRPQFLLRVHNRFS